MSLLPDSSPFPSQPRLETRAVFSDLSKLLTTLGGARPEGSEAERQFISQWITEGRQFPEGREIFLRNCFRAAERYPHPNGGAAGSGAVLVDLTQNLTFRSSELALTRWPGYQVQIQEVLWDPSRRQPYVSAAKRTPYQPALAPEEYQRHLGALPAPAHECPLCGHLVQGIDDIAKGEPSVLLALGDGYALLPNRFPPSPGPLDLLLVPTQHDASRGEAFGKSISRRDLLAVREVCRELGMAAQHNHVLDGMSVPQHDHWKLTPAELPAGKWREFARAALEQAGTEKVWCGAVNCTPFDMRFIAGRDSMLVLDRTAEILERLEQGGEVFTVSYVDGVFAILPRWTEGLKGVPLMPPLSSAVGTHLMVKNESRLMRALERFVPLQGEFAWERYVGAVPQVPETRGLPSANRALAHGTVLWSDELPASLAGKTAVVIDVLAATTNIADFLAAGAELYLTNSKNVLRDLELLKARGQAPLLVGETLDPELHSKLRFDCSNDPLVIRERGLLQRLQGQAVLYLSNNGTRVVVDALRRGAARVLAGSFVTAAAIAKAVRADHAEAVILPAGELQFADELREGEDFECAHYLSRLIRGQHPEVDRYLATSAAYTHRRYPSLQPPEVRAGYGARIDRYLEIVLATDRLPVVPVCFQEGGSWLIRAMDMSHSMQ